MPANRRRQRRRDYRRKVMGQYWNTALTARMVVEACVAQGVDPGPILAALTRFGDYLPLMNNWATTHSEDHGDRIHLVTEVVWGAVPRTSAEYIAAILVERSRIIWGTPWAPDLIRFEFGEPAAARPGRPVVLDDCRGGSQ